jgi:hypothetical protein
MGNRKLKLEAKYRALMCVVILSVACYSVPRTTADDNTAPQRVGEVPDRGDVQKPTGDEVDLQVKVVGRKRAVIIVTNRSNETVYTSYIPGGRDKFALHAILTYERLEPENHTFREWGGNDFGTGLQPLPARDSFKDSFSAPEGGTYRVSLRFIVDTNLSHRVNRLARLSKSERQEESRSLDELMKVASHTVVSAPFTLDAN